MARAGPLLFAVLPERFRASVPPVSDTEDAGEARRLDPVRPWRLRPRSAAVAPAAGTAEPRGPEAEHDRTGAGADQRRLEAECARLAEELAAARSRTRRVEHELATSKAARLAEREAAESERADADRVAAEREREWVAERDRDRAAARSERDAARGELDAAHRRAERAEQTLTEAVELIETERSRALADAREQAARLGSAEQCARAAEQRAERAEQCARAAEQRAERAEQRADAMRREVLEELAAERARMQAELGRTGAAGG